jgi:hypothetical protein
MKWAISRRLTRSRPVALRENFWRFLLAVAFAGVVEVFARRETNS